MKSSWRWEFEVHCLILCHNVTRCIECASASLSPARKHRRNLQINGFTSMHYWYLCWDASCYLLLRNWAALRVFWRNIVKRMRGERCKEFVVVLPRRGHLLHQCISTIHLYQVLKVHCKINTPLCIIYWFHYSAQPTTALKEELGKGD